MKSKRNGPWRPSRREVLAAGAGAGALIVLGCGSGDGGGDGGTGPDSAVPDLGAPEVSSALWQTMAAYGRASADGTLGTRINMFNPAPVPQRVVVQVFTQAGQLVARDARWSAFGPNKSWHIELAELLAEHDVPLPFEGSLWVGTTPESGLTFMGLQGITFDWYGPAHLATVHGMRDFGNSNHDAVWSDLVLPKIVLGPRYVTKVALLNASADGISEPLLAKPQLIIRADDGAVIADTLLDELPPYCSKLYDMRDYVDGGLAAGSIQVREPTCGLVGSAFVVDTENGGFANADHLFDRHFVVDGTGFTG
jgi:hypothetical protein